MTEQSNDGKAVHYVAPDQLRAGLFIYIDLPWFKHPFTLNSFKIKTEEQIHDLHALKQALFRYDPDRSDVQVTGSAPATPDLSMVVPQAEHSEAGDPVVAEKAARMQQVTQFRERVDRVEKTFVKAASVMRNLHRNLLARPQETLEETHGLVGQMVSAFLDHPEVALHVMGEKSGGEDVYFHSLNVSILSMMLAKAMGLSVAQGQLLGAGALMHDIGLGEVPDRVLKKRPDEYTKPERELRAMHVEYGVKLGQQFGLPKDVLAIIAQHHEMADGSGYPLGLKLDKISPLARIVSLVNFYDNLCNPVDISQAMTPHEALSFMFAQKRAKFDSQMLQLMIRCLGVYPPGSVVKLSNEAIALVVSVNTQKPLRPWVLLYDPSVPKEQAITLDLEKEADIQISKAIRPALLPSLVSAYLNPRKHVTYFFDGNAASNGSGG